MADPNRCHACGREIVEASTHVCPGDATITARPSPDEEGPAIPRAGDVLAGRWELVALVGAGGGGTVYRALDRELGAEVALKVLHPTYTSDALRRRFRREIRVTRAIDHPCVSRVFELGESGGLEFLTMRWIEGESLQRRVSRDGPLSVHALRRLADGLVAALAATHRRGVVHRDVKPANVLVSLAGSPVLVDFGIASEERLAPGSTPSSAPGTPDEITADAGAPGTPAYMSPEQRRGEATPPATDLWAMALTLSFAATGAVGRPTDPRRAFAPFGAPLASFLARCLEEDPARRPADATAIEDALSRYRERRRLLRASTIGAALLVAGAAIAAVVVPGRGAPPVVWVASIENGTGDASLDWLERGVADLVATGLEADGATIARDAAGRRGAVKVAGRVVQERGSASVRLTLRSANGPILARTAIPNATGDALFAGVDRAVDRFADSLELRRTRRRAPPPTEGIDAFAHWAKAQDRLATHRVPAALDELREATRIDPTFALAQLQRYVIVSSGGYGPHAEAEAALAHAVEHRDRLPPDQREFLRAVEGVSERTPGSFDRLRAWLRAHPPETATYWMAFRMAGDDPVRRREVLAEWIARLPADPEPHNQLGFLLLLRFSDPRGAERELREYMRLAPGEPNPHDSLGDVLRVEHRWDEALAEYDRALAIDPAFTSAAVDAAITEILRDDLDRADVRLVHAREVVPPESRDFARVVGIAATIPLVRGDPAGARARLDALAADPAVGSQAWTAHEWAAIAAALDGDAGESRRRAVEADRLHRLYHGNTSGLPTLAPYVEGLLARRANDGAGFGRALAGLRSAGLDGSSTGRIGLFEGLEARLAGDPGRAAERFVRAAPADTGGAVFLSIVERARALVAAGRVGDARDAYDEAIGRRDGFAITAECAHEWRPCLEEAAALARTAGDVAKAAALDARLAALAPR